MNYGQDMYIDMYVYIYIYIHIYIYKPSKRSIALTLAAVEAPELK